MDGNQCGDSFFCSRKILRERALGKRRGFEIRGYYSRMFFVLGTRRGFCETNTGAASSMGGETEMYLMPAVYCGALTRGAFIKFSFFFFAILRGMS